MPFTFLYISFFGNFSALPPGSRAPSRNFRRANPNLRQTSPPFRKKSPENFSTPPTSPPRFPAEAGEIP